MRIDLPVPAIVIRAKLVVDDDLRNDHGDYPFLGSVIVQWEEVRPDDDRRVVHEIIVWTGQPHYDAPGYATEEAENAARQEAAEWLASRLHDRVLT